MFAISLLLSILFSFAPETYQSAVVDASGQLHITTDSGKELMPRKLPDQLSFEDPKISPDHQTVGWLVMYPFPTPDNDEKYGRDRAIAGKLVIYRAGHVVHVFPTEQVFWAWYFLDSKSVAYLTGPTHGNAGPYLLRDISSGKIIARLVGRR